MDGRKEDTFKVCVIGTNKSGKTSLIRRFVRGEYDEDGVGGGIGAAFFRQKIPLEEEKIVNLDIWDTPSGQERYGYSIGREMFMRGSSCIIIVYDVTIKHSLVHGVVSSIKKILRGGFLDYTSKFRNLMIVGNKTDLIDEREVNEGDELLTDFIKEQELFLNQQYEKDFKEKRVPYVPYRIIHRFTSAKKGKGVTEMFFEVAKILNENKGGKSQNDIENEITKSKKFKTDKKCKIS